MSVANLFTSPNIIKITFPKALFTLGYGSAFIKQSSAFPGQPDLLVFYPQDLFRINSRFSIGPPVRYHLSKQIETTVCKYGEVDYDLTMQHLLDWKSFYLPGRLQKPFVVLDVSDEATYKIFDERNRFNRLRALRLAAAVTLNNSSGECETKTLITELVSLSYLGDVRIGLAENPFKIKNIVEGQYEALLDIYKPLMKEAGLSLNSDGSRVTGNIFLNKEIERLERLNRKESVQIAIKGLLTNDFKTSLKYLIRKVNKSFSSR